MISSSGDFFHYFLQSESSAAAALNMCHKKALMLTERDAFLTRNFSVQCSNAVSQCIVANSRKNFFHELIVLQAIPSRHVPSEDAKRIRAGGHGVLSGRHHAGLRNLLYESRRFSGLHFVRNVPRRHACEGSGARHEARRVQAVRGLARQETCL